MGRGEIDRDLVAMRTDRVFVSVAMKQRATNLGHVLVCPVEHVTALHTVESPLLAEVFNVVARVTRVVPSTFGAVGTTVLNNNAPDQLISHLHVHVIPRFINDNLSIPNPNKTPAPRNLRADLATRLRRALA